MDRRSPVVVVIQTLQQVIKGHNLPHLRFGTGQNGGMPKYARPATGGELQDPVEALGSMLRAGVIGHLRAHGPSGRAEIARALELPLMTIANALKDLYAAGLLIADPPLEQAQRGQRVWYQVNNAAVTEMYLRLGQAIGEV